MPKPVEKLFNYRAKSDEIPAIFDERQAEPEIFAAIQPIFCQYLKKYSIMVPFYSISGAGYP